MTTVQQLEANPFALMTDPEAIFAAMAGSERLARLTSRICRPLDKPLIARSDEDAEVFDEAMGREESEERSCGVSIRI